MHYNGGYGGGWRGKEPKYKRRKLGDTSGYSLSSIKMISLVLIFCIYVLIIVSLINFFIYKPTVEALKKITEIQSPSDVNEKKPSNKPDLIDFLEKLGKK